MKSGNIIKISSYPILRKIKQYDKNGDFRKELKYMAYWLHCQTCKKWTKSITPLSEDKLCFYCNNPLVKPKQIFPASIKNITYNKSDEFENKLGNTVTDKQDLYNEIPIDNEVTWDKTQESITEIKEPESDTTGSRQLKEHELDITEPEVSEMSKLDPNKGEMPQAHDLYPTESDENGISTFLDSANFEKLAMQKLGPNKSESNDLPKLNPANFERSETQGSNTNKTEKNVVPEFNTANFETLEEQSSELTEPKSSTAGVIGSELPHRQAESKKPVEKKPLIRKDIPSPPLKYMLVDELMIKDTPSHKINIKNKNLE